MLLKHLLTFIVMVSVTRGTCLTLYAQGVSTYQQPPLYSQQNYQQHQQHQQPKPSLTNRIKSFFGGSEEKEENKRTPVAPANVAPPPGYNEQPIVGTQPVGQPVAPPRPTQRTGSSSVNTGIAANSRDSHPSAPSRSTSSLAASASSGENSSYYDKLKDWQSRDMDLLVNKTDSDSEIKSDLPAPPNISSIARDDETTAPRRSGSVPLRTPPRSAPVEEEEVHVAQDTPPKITTPRSSPKPEGLQPLVPTEELPPRKPVASKNPTLNLTPATETKARPRGVIASRKPVAEDDITRTDLAPEPMATPVTSVKSQMALEIIPSGPKNVYVGQEAGYEFKVINNSGTFAEEVVVTIEIPSWVELIQQEQSLGTISWNPVNNEFNSFKWFLGRLSSNQNATLKLHIIPHAPKPINLVPKYDFRQTSSEMAIDVRQPNVVMSFEGPEETVWGTENTYTLKMRNTGNGDAKNIKVTFYASGSEPQEAPPVEDLKVGEEHEMSITLTSFFSGNLVIQAQAAGPYGVSAEAVKQVVVLRPELETFVDGPAFQFVGNPMEYVITARNTGNAPAENAEIIAMIPQGMKYISCSEGGDFIESQSEVHWQIDSIPQGQEFSCSVIVEARREGECQLAAKSLADTGIQASGSCVSVVEAIADVSFEIKPPKNPWEVGKEGEYQITVTNRGTKMAQGIDMTASFSEGLDPTGISGLNGRLDSDAVVVADRIPSLAPAQSVTCTIKAMAKTDGNHKIHVTVTCQSTGTNLSAQEMTYYFKRRGLRDSTGAGTGINPSMEAPQSMTPRPIPPPAGTMPGTNGSMTGTMTGTMPGHVSPFPQNGTLLPMQPNRNPAGNGTGIPQGMNPPATVPVTPMPTPLSGPGGAGVIPSAQPGAAVPYTVPVAQPANTAIPPMPVTAVPPPTHLPPAVSAPSPGVPSPPISVPSGNVPPSGVPSALPSPPQR
ncbi:MAG: DUF11 domain-containing protein [Planctomycetaceae bacterium]|jgi:uncharacterized repeat protein (TIGR01451 family)|nr:DUF11 domain-containing protein [Planctomycetaceae bacterium]